MTLLDPCPCIVQVSLQGNRPGTKSSCPGLNTGWHFFRAQYAALAEFNFTGSSYYATSYF